MDKIRNGLYTVNYPVNNDVKITFTVERNEGDFDRNIGRWIVTENIQNEVNQWDLDFGTLQDAVVSIQNLMKSGEFRYTKGLGWCYYEISS